MRSSRNGFETDRSAQLFDTAGWQHLVASLLIFQNQTNLEPSPSVRFILDIPSHSERTLDKFQIGSHILALAAAFALAAPIGWDREKKARSAGLRTFPLVAMASCGFVQASEHLLVHSPDGMAKVIEGLITGIGFIGGGAILKQGTTVLGTATAASLWATGAIGVSVGLGAFDVAVTVAVFTFLTLTLLPLVKDDDEKTEKKD